MSDHLPLDIIREILYKLPIKSLVRFTSVCKFWDSLIKSQAFVSTYLAKTVSSNNSNKTNLLLFRLCSAEQGGRVEHYSLRFDNKEVGEYKQLHFPFIDVFRDPYFRVVGSCNGLLCLANDIRHSCYTFILWNPIIHKAFVVPTPNVTFSSHGCHDAFLGFGFDSKNNDYKLLRFVELDRGGSCEIFVEVELYSLNANCWKRITDITPKCGIHIIHDRSFGHNFVNGAIHFLAYRRIPDPKHLAKSDYSPFVLAFNVSEEVFHEIPLPVPEGLGIFYWLFDVYLVKYRESSIAVMKEDRNQISQIHMWVMKEYGVATSWTKLSILEGIPRVLYFRKNGEVFVIKHGWEESRKIVLNDLSSQHFEFFGVRTESGFSIIDSFVESLVLLDKGKLDTDVSLDLISEERST